MLAVADSSLNLAKHTLSEHKLAKSKGIAKPDVDAKDNYVLAGMH